MSGVQKFTDLETWQVGHRVVLDVYRITKTFPSDEKFGLTSQLRRSSISITSNIAEGFGRKYPKEKNRFYYFASSSIAEVQNQLIIAKDVGYISEEIFQSIFTITESSYRLIRALINSTNKKITK